MIQHPVMLALVPRLNLVLDLRRRERIGGPENRSFAHTKFFVPLPAGHIISAVAATALKLARK
jgi:hypothetical protein